MQDNTNQVTSSSSGLQNLMSNYYSDDHSDLEEGEILDDEEQQPPTIETDKHIQENSATQLGAQLNSPPRSCCVCFKERIPYKCPGCTRNYCSAICCKQHKITFDCDGKRNKIPYVPLVNFNQKQFLDDYFFLEEVDQKIDNARRLKPKLSLLKRKNNIRRKQRNSNNKNRRAISRSKPQNQDSA